MAGKQPNSAKHQFEHLDQAGKDILNNLVEADIKEVEWPAGKEPKFDKKRGLKYSQALYDTNLKKYMCNNTNLPFPENEAIKIDLGDSALYYCIHPEEKKYIRIISPKEMTAKYTVFPTAAHMMRG